MTTDPKAYDAAVLAYIRASWRGGDYERDVCAGLLAALPLMPEVQALLRLGRASMKLPLQDATREARVEYVDALAALPPEIRRVMEE